jgi:GT2 family glycosyltransferase
MENIQVIIPVMNTKVFQILANNIVDNIYKPSRIITINNSGEDIPKNPFKEYEIDYTVITPPKPLCVNESWNLGISKLLKCDFVSILNDDIQIPQTFFQNLIQGFKHYPDAGVICPHTVTDKKDGCNITSNEFTKMKHKEGWAFTIRKNILDTIPPIPPNLKLFFGDDWFWWHVYKKGFLWYKDTSIEIFHHVGLSVRRINIEERTKIIRKERKIWYDFKTNFMKHGV